MVKKTRAIVTGSVDTDEKAVNWLREHGATTEDSLALTIITLPETALVEKGAYDWQYTISFYDDVGDITGEYVEVELDVDAYETILRLRTDGAQG